MLDVDAAVLSEVTPERAFFFLMLSISSKQSMLRHGRDG
jgi:hypothetical protein